MEDILLFGGTTEGRELAEWLSDRGCPVTVCVATDYGASLLPAGCPGLTVHTGRLDEAAMEAMMASRPFRCIIDATHPYAAQVTTNIRVCCERLGLTCHRLIREEPPEGDWLHADSVARAAELLRGLSGNVLLTTGSKELMPFAADDLRERCFPRVLPSRASLEACLSLRFPPAHIIAMQGPFSQELDCALIRQFQIRTVVTKASGGAGGFWEKLAAARETGCQVIVIDRPLRETGDTLEEIESKWERGML
ncbi:precorrin-6A reductase [Pseudoflavonifractor sp. MSJ-37]|uniref:precorrin-6A reductase n=1 Tax=Pseudoflavonifractor sp. MSJ-37 TaxID=2841531 RepID=UPI001C0F5DCE|nr:precorrin-6A reductase [Pseudoflavonifractor sp. MSJ-37]MBU5434723.1 precorrin-6A reductase [Pseudoflavonifractor sp. MSJ-37]